MYSMELGRSPVISSDTSGIWLKDDFAFASCGHDIICFDLKVGKELWRTRVFGFCGRHFPVVDSQRVYYTTLKGEVGCADILNGSSALFSFFVDNASFFYVMSNIGNVHAYFP